jgi:hypothetical protein
VGIARVRVPTGKRRRWVVPDESLLRRIHAGLESLR